MTSPNAPLFTGWHRDTLSDPWRELVTSYSRGECWELLAGQAQHGDLAVTEDGGRPDHGPLAAHPSRIDLATTRVRCRDRVELLRRLAGTLGGLNLPRNHQR